MDQPLFDSFQKACEPVSVRDAQTGNRAGFAANPKSGSQTSIAAEEFSLNSIIKTQSLSQKKRKKKHWQLFTLCIFNRHRPIGHSVHWAGEDYVGHCRKCSLAIQRIKKSATRSIWIRNPNRSKK